MKTFLLGMLMLASSILHAQVAPLNNIVSLMRETPASVNGSLQFSRATNLFRDTSGIIPKTVEIKAARNIDFYFDEDSLNLNTKNALYVWLGGIKCKINSVNFNNKTGQFKVDSDTPLGLFDGKFSAKVKTIVEGLYKKKLQTAFAELKRIRHEQSADQAQSSLQAIIKVLSSEGKGPALPVISGDVALNFSPERDRKVQLADDLFANVKAGDTISMGSTFTLVNNKTVFKSMTLLSREGIRMNGSTRWPEIKSINLRQLELSDKGITMNYAVGAEEVIQGLILALNMVTSANGREPSSVDCPGDIEIAAIRQQIDKAFMGQLNILLRNNRETLINAGVSAKLIDSLIRR